MGALVGCADDAWLPIASHTGHGAWKLVNGKGCLLLPVILTVFTCVLVLIHDLSCIEHYAAVKRINSLNIKALNHDILTSSLSRKLESGCNRMTNRLSSSVRSIGSIQTKRQFLRHLLHCQLDEERRSGKRRKRSLTELRFSKAGENSGEAAMTRRNTHLNHWEVR